MEDQTSSKGKINLIPDITAFRDIDDFLGKYSNKSADKNNNSKVHTNTRIGNKSKGIPGASYNIPDAVYPLFLELYYRDIVSKNKKEYLTEKQRTDDGPLVIDLDFRYDYSVDEKLHTDENLTDLIEIYLQEIKSIYQLDDQQEITVYVMEKPSVNRIEKDKLTKDGIHLLFDIQCEREVQMMIREGVLNNIGDVLKDLPLTNSWDNVLDAGISKGTTNWQLFGSRKPGYDKYTLTRIFNYVYDSTDGEFQYNEIPLSKFDMKKNYYKLSVRNKDNSSLFMRNDFIMKLEERKNKNKKSKPISPSSSINTIRNHSYDTNMIYDIKNKDELDYATNCFLDKVTNNDEYILKTIHEYAMILPEPYYSEYDKWIRVGFALKNIDNKLLITWIAFSAKWDKFDYTMVSEICERWNNFEYKPSDGLTKLSLIHWVKKECPEAYEEINKNSLEYYIDQTISTTNPKYKAPDNDVAKVVYQKFKNEYVCTSMKNGIWFRYEGNRWKEDDQAVTLRQAISGPIRNLYNNKLLELMTANTTSNRSLNQIGQRDEDTEQEHDINKIKNIQALHIHTRLGQTADKAKILTECKEFFYDNTFANKLDENKYLLCFKNGVVDFSVEEELTFRDGHPEDYITLCTGINYIKLTEKHEPIVQEIKTFMSELFPDEEVCKYMWEHLASTLIGSAPDQTFNMYYGAGQNGKSVLTSLMKKVLGEYANVHAPLCLVTGERPQTGGLSPEIVALKGRRYAVMQEPSKKDVINEGAMKQITSGKDAMSGRAPYQPAEVAFYPQCKLVVACNVLMGVKSNDHGTWRRIRTVPFKSLFTNNPVDNDKEKPYQFKLVPNIEDKFEKWKEVMASLLVNIAFKTKGKVTDCDIVTEKSNEYRKSQDCVSQFANDKLIRCDNGKVRKNELNSEFTMWYASNYGSGKPPTNKEVHEYMDKTYGKNKNQIWKGVKIQYEEDSDDELIENDDINEEDL